MQRVQQAQKGLAGNIFGHLLILDAQVRVAVDFREVAIVNLTQGVAIQCKRSG